MTPRPGQIVWVGLNPTEGHEQQGDRPAIVIAAAPMGTMTIIVPLTSTPPKAPSHHRMAGKRMSVARCEQVRSIDVTRIRRTAGVADPADLATVRRTVAWLIGVQPRT